MGGPGSGEWMKQHCKNLIENVPRIEVGLWQRTKRLAAGTSFIHSLITSDGKPHGSMRVIACGSSVEISYLLDSELVNNLVAINWVQCKICYRALFVCPNCGKRVMHLYLDGKYLLCRNCYRLAYKSQRTAKDI